MFAAKLSSRGVGISHSTGDQKVLKLHLQTGIILRQCWPLSTVGGVIHRLSVTDLPR